jgi:Tol biopolymer transport system component
VFVSGDSYAGGSFSTRTTIFDLAGGRGLGDLEQFGVTRGGSPFKQQDFNFWGVTFAPDGDRFYATLSTGGGLYLIEGRVSERTMRVLREGVECPSLSPDGGRIAFKVRAFDGGRLVWRLRILDLATGRHVDIAESRSIDDQAEWLDNDRVLYALPRGAGSGSSDVWSARADGAGSPALFISDAFSPAIVR